eukprot:3112518-Prymnesium_polylepis.2
MSPDEAGRPLVHTAPRSQELIEYCRCQKGLSASHGATADGPPPHARSAKSAGAAALAQERCESIRSR